MFISCSKDTTFDQSIPESLFERQEKLSKLGQSFFLLEYLLSLEREHEFSIKPAVTGFWGLLALDYLDNLSLFWFWSGSVFTKSQEKEPRDYGSSLGWLK